MFVNECLPTRDDPINSIPCMWNIGVWDISGILCINGWGRIASGVKIRSHVHEKYQLYTTDSDLCRAFTWPPGTWNPYENHISWGSIARTNTRGIKCTIFNELVPLRDPTRQVLVLAFIPHLHSQKMHFCYNFRKSQSESIRSRRIFPDPLNIVHFIQRVCIPRI